MNDYQRKSPRKKYNKPRIRISTPGLWRDFFKAHGLVEEAPCSCFRILRSGKKVPAIYVYCPETDWDAEGWYCPVCAKGHAKQRVSA